MRNTLYLEFPCSQWLGYASELWWREAEGAQALAEAIEEEALWAQQLGFEVCRLFISPDQAALLRTVGAYPTT